MYIGLLFGFVVGLWIGIGVKVYFLFVIKVFVIIEGCKVEVMFINSIFNLIRYIYIFV